MGTTDTSLGVELCLDLIVLPALVFVGGLVSILAPQKILSANAFLASVFAGTEPIEGHLFWSKGWIRGWGFVCVLPTFVWGLILVRPPVAFVPLIVAISLGALSWSTVAAVKRERRSQRKDSPAEQLPQPDPEDEATPSGPSPRPQGPA